MQRERAQATGSKRVQASNSAPSLEAHAELLAVLAKPCLYPHEQPYNSVDKPVHTSVAPTASVIKMFATCSRDAISVPDGKRK